MDKGLRAVFYEYKYYLLPDGITKDEVVASKEITLTRLEVAVKLYTSQEYDAILGEKVDAVCPGCARYTDDGTKDLDGHHREMSLSGKCYERREEGEKPTFAVAAQWFWWQVSQKSDALKACIDTGNRKKLNKTLNDILTKISYPLYFYGTITDGKYSLYISDDRTLPPSYKSIIAYLAAVANKSEMKDMGWSVCAGYTKGVFIYDGKKSYDDDAAALYLKESEPPYRFDVCIYRPHPEKLSEKTQSKLIDETCDRLRAEVGESVEAALVGRYLIGTDSSQAKSLKEISETLCLCYAEAYGDADADIYPPIFGYGTAEAVDKDNAYPYKYNIPDAVTCAIDVPLIERPDGSEKFWWSDFMTFAYIVFDTDAEEAREVFGWYMRNIDLVPEPLRDPDDVTLSAMGVGNGLCERGWFFDNFVFDERKFFVNLRMMAPVLAAYGAKLVLIDDGGIRCFSCGYTFEPETV